MNTLNRVAYAPALAGTGRMSAFKDLNVSHANFVASGFEPGFIFQFEGNVYQIVRTVAALAEGDVVIPYMAAAGRIGTADASTTSTLITNDDLATKNIIKNGYVHKDGGTGAGETRRIISHTSGAKSVVTVALADRAHNATAAQSANVWTAPDGTTTYTLYAPWEVTKSAAEYDKVQGVALGTVTANYWTIIQIGGVARITAAGDTQALVAGGGLVVSGAAGVARGTDITPADAAAALKEARAEFAVPIHASSAAASICLAILGGPGLIQPMYPA